MNDTTTATGEPMVISCDGCRAAGTDACDDCLVTFLCSEPRSSRSADSVVVDLEEFRAIRRLQSAGLAPELRWVGEADGATR